jgi:hypothetical protein
MLQINGNKVSTLPNCNNNNNKLLRNVTIEGGEEEQEHERSV